MTRPQAIDSKLSEILGALRRIWSALKERVVPSQPVAVPVPVRANSRR